MKKREIGKIFKKLNLRVRTTGHYYEWLVKDLSDSYSRKRFVYNYTVLMLTNGSLLRLIDLRDWKEDILSEY
ncbi:MAG: hypothetical protein SCABRO_03799 [Candidatus Scalindua brodae]|uniref:Uncharacterized protein n=1 Tax=Candidatus Scalindua brodae TaxID=237368 RepID=A0A0B0EEB3_9BACT|nr:MAG: hypothetical protein SCABRO_03799 [Candidatus Scalindua brodae]